MITFRCSSPQGSKSLKRFVAYDACYREDIRYFGVPFSVTEHFWFQLHLLLVVRAIFFFCQLCSAHHLAIHNDCRDDDSTVIPLKPLPLPSLALTDPSTTSRTRLQEALPAMKR